MRRRRHDGIHPAVLKRQDRAEPLRELLDPRDDSLEDLRHRTPGGDEPQDPGLERRRSLRRHPLGDQDSEGQRHRDQEQLEDLDGGVAVTPGDRKERTPSVAGPQRDDDRRQRSRARGPPRPETDPRVERDREDGDEEQDARHADGKQAHQQENPDGRSSSHQRGEGGPTPLERLRGRGEPDRGRWNDGEDAQGVHPPPAEVVEGHVRVGREERPSEPGGDDARHGGRARRHHEGEDVLQPRRAWRRTRVFPRRYAPRSASVALPAAAVIAYTVAFPASRRWPAAQAATTHHSLAPSSQSPATATPEGNQMTAWSTESPTPSRT